MWSQRSTSPCNELGIRTLLHRSGIENEKGYSTVTLLFALIVLSVITQSVPFGIMNLIQVHKDIYYRFLNHPCFNWRKLVTLLAWREITRTDQTPFNEKVIIADDSLPEKTGENMELVSYHHDHTTNRTKLGYQMLRVGYHNGTRFYPPNAGFHASEKRPNEKLREIDISSWQIRAAILHVELPRAGRVSIVFVRRSKKNRHAFLSTESEDSRDPRLLLSKMGNRVLLQRLQTAPRAWQGPE